MRRRDEEKRHVNNEKRIVYIQGRKSWHDQFWLANEK